MRRHFIFAMAVLATSVSITNGCVQETGSESTDPTLVCFHASFEDASTKTSYAGSGKVDWSEGDVIRYYMAKNGTVGEHTVPQAGHKTDINAAVTPGSSFFVAAYGGESVSSNTSTSFTLRGAVKAEQSGTFGDAHVAACRTGDVSGATPLSFYNLTSLVSFSVSRTDIAYVTFTAIGGEALHGNGTLNVCFSQDDIPSASFGSSTGSSIRIDLEGPGVYYIATLPTTLSQGFRLEYYSSSNVLIGHTDAHRSQTLARNGLLRLGPLERHIESETPTGGDESGMYLGIIGFNQMLYRYPIGHLDEDSKSGFTAFVDELPSKDGTLLYYSVEEAVNSLLAADFPSDLYSVSMVTFTDGLDQGSMMMTTLYESDEDYLEAIGRRVAEEKVSGLPISAYSIGLRGSDVTDVNKFRSNLKALASNDANAFEASSMSAVNSKFQDIAEKVNGSTYTYSLSLTIPGPSNGTRIRFTLDNVSSASYSKTYIEGVFNLKNRSLTDVVYYGLTSTTGSTVQGTVDGIFVTFSFEGLQTSDNSFIQQGNIKQWNYVASSSSWQKNSEFSPAQNSTIGHYKRSAVVMLVLDCSSSLGSQFSTMKGSAKSFINTLAEAAEDKYSVASVTLDKTEMTLLLGGSATLYATILPATALEKGLVWTSSDESVATVDQSGKVTAVGLGKSSITVTTVDGAKTATCEVTVKQLAQSITLNRTELEMYVGDKPITLVATVLPENTSDKSVTWTSSDDSTATVDADGKVTAVSSGSTKITVKANDGSNVSAACMVTVKDLSLPATVEAIDLGLPSGLKWATMNVGATKPEEYGEYFAWGETEPKTYYSWSTYKWCNGSNNTQTKYNTKSSYGTVDNKTVLDPEDDAAHVNWGGSWRMPTKEEQDELRTNCTWTWTTQNGVKGRLVTGPNGKSIFLPAAGDRRDTGLYDTGSWGIYWSSSLGTEFPSNASDVNFNSGGVDRVNDGRYYGFSVRPVYADIPVKSVSIDKTTLNLSVGATTVLTATVFPSNVGNKSVTWTSSNPSVASVDQSGKVTAMGPGKSFITVTTVDGAKTATCEVTVKQLAQSITLNRTKLEMYVWDEPITLVATVLPENTSDKSVTWTSSDNSTATVDADGKVTAVSSGSTKITVKANDGSNVSAACMVTVKIDLSLPATVEAVDLGLPSGLKWATMNVGARRPEGYGVYFAWGETEANYERGWEYDNEYSDWTKLETELWRSNKWCNSYVSSSPAFAKYCPTDKTTYWAGSGSPDNKTVLDPEDDAASANWGGNWRMPTDTEWAELRENCTWTWITQNGVNGYTVSRNGNSIFLPAAGWSEMYLAREGSQGSYWSSSLNTDYPYSAWHVHFGAHNVYRGSGSRYYWKSVRPVYGVFVPVASISLDKTSLTLYYEDTYKLKATINPANASAKDVHWESGDLSVAKVDNNGLVTAVFVGTTTITAYGSNGVGASCVVTVTPKDIKPEAVDLGLSVKWATFNVGATKPEGYGAYFAWGETKPKEDYSYSTYKWCNGKYNKLTKYCTDSSCWDSFSPMDNKTVLDPEDDAASVNWGGSWRMPTDAECTELINNCTWTWTANYNETGIAGRIVTSNMTGYTDKSIFLPASGFWDSAGLNSVGSSGCYWSSSLNTDDPSRAWYYVITYSGNVYMSNYNGRSRGISIRPVCPKD